MENFIWLRGKNAKFSPTVEMRILDLFSDGQIFFESPLLPKLEEIAELSLPSDSLCKRESPFVVPLSKSKNSHSSKKN